MKMFGLLYCHEMPLYTAIYLAIIIFVIVLLRSSCLENYVVIKMFNGVVN